MASERPAWPRVVATRLPTSARPSRIWPSRRRDRQAHAQASRRRAGRPASGAADRLYRPRRGQGRARRYPGSGPAPSHRRHAIGAGRGDDCHRNGRPPPRSSIEHIVLSWRAGEQPTIRHISQALRSCSRRRACADTQVIWTQHLGEPATGIEGERAKAPSLKIPGRTGDGGRRSHSVRFASARRLRPPL